nr:YTH domain-containing protein [Tanacetum cinerariifolium]
MFQVSVVGLQWFSSVSGTDSYYSNQIAPSRTFCMKRAQLYVGKVTDGYKSNGGHINKFATNVGVNSDSVSSLASSQMLPAIMIVWLLCCWKLMSESCNISPTSIQMFLHLLFIEVSYG